MPNVTVLFSPPCDYSEEAKIKFETACKKAWCAMGEGFNASDVGGVFVRVPGGVTVARAAPTLVFAYVDRGEEFDQKLARALFAEVGHVGCMSLVVTCPTPPHAWFADPIWAIAPAKA